MQYYMVMPSSGELGHRDLVRLSLAMIVYFCSFVSLVGLDLTVRSVITAIDSSIEL